MNKKQITISIAAIITGLIFFFIYNQYIIVFQRCAPTKALQAVRMQSKTIVVEGWLQQKHTSEKVTVAWPDKADEQMTVLIKQWLLFMEDDKNMVLGTALELASLSPNQKELFISLNQSPFHSHISCYDKLTWLQGLLNTLAPHTQTIQKIYLLVHHQPPNDAHIMFEIGIPLVGFL